MEKGDEDDFDPGDITKKMIDMLERFDSMSKIPVKIYFRLFRIPVIHCPIELEAEIPPEREVFTEVREEGDCVVIIAELPGLSREEIEFRGNEKEIDIVTRGRTVSVPLPCPVDLEAANSRYSNGIVEARFRKLA